MTASAVLSALRNVVDPVSVSVKELYSNGFPYNAVLSGVN
jgi:hypothetical protein